MSGNVTFTPIADDQVDVARGNFLRGIRRARFWVRAAILLLFGGALGATTGYLDGHLEVTDIMSGTLFAAGWLMVLMGVSFALMSRRARRLFRQQRVLDREHELAWSDEGTVLRSADSTSQVRWGEYFCWFETRRVFAFGLNEQLFHCLPKRAMNDAAIADLRRTAETFGPR